MKTYNYGDMIAITWVDSCAAGSVWNNSDQYDYEDHDRCMIIVSIGFFVKKTAQSIYISQSQDVCEENKVGNLFAIPNRMITGIKELKAGK
jgi:hypothetical protein